MPAAIPAATARRSRRFAGPSPKRSGAPSPAAPPEGIPETTPRVSAAERLAQSARRAARRLRRIPAPRGDRRIAHTRRAARAPARNGPDARHGQSSEGVLPGQRGPLPRRGLPGQGLPLARTGGDLRARRCACGAAPSTAAPTDRGRATSSRRSSATSARRSRCGRMPETVRGTLSAQMGKAGPPMDGKDLHVGDLAWGILPPAAPLSISSLTIAGMAMAFAREGSGRVAVSFIGEGGTSLGEWHEAINLCAARRLPAIFCVQNNQTALSTPVADQSAARVFAEKARGLRDPGHHARRHRSRGDRRGLRLGGRAGARRRRAGAPRARLHAHLRARAPRRHALPRQGAADLVGLSAAPRGRLCRSRPLRLLVAPRSAQALRGAPDGRRRDRAGRSRAFRAGGRGRRRGARREGSSTRRGRSPSARARASSRASRHAGRRSRSIPPCGAARTRPCRRSRPVLPSIRKAGRSSRRSPSASATRCARIRASSSTARTWAASTATRFSCCGRCSRTTATGSGTRRSPRAQCSASASARRSRANARSARCSSTTSWPPDSTSS